jgi:hypothetical protein
MTDQELKDLVASLAIAQAKTDAQLSKTDLKLDKLAKMIGSMSKNQGDVAEEFFYNSLQKKLKIGDIQFDQIALNLLLGSKGKSQEFDLVLFNGKSVAIVEVKYKLHTNDLIQVQEQIKAYKKAMPIYKDFAIYGGVAGLSVPKDVIDQAEEMGLFVLQQVGQTMSSCTQGMRAH